METCLIKYHLDPDLDGYSGNELVTISAIGINPGKAARIRQRGSRVAYWSHATSMRPATTMKCSFNREFYSNLSFCKIYFAGHISHQ